MEGGEEASELPVHVPTKPAKPQKPNRGYVRQRLVPQTARKSNLETLSSTSATSHLQLQGQVLHTLSGLSAIAPSLSVVLAHPDLECEDFMDMGFAGVQSWLQFVESFKVQPEFSPDVSGMIVVSPGLDVQAAVDCCRTVDRFTNPPPCIVVLIVPGGEPPEAGGSAMQSVKACLESGADDVITLTAKQVVTGRRVQEAIFRTELMARKASVLINQEVEVVKKKTAKTLQGAWNKFMWDFPGKVLEHIPVVDTGLVEQIQTGVGVGDYTFKDQLGAGTFGAVFKSQHPQHGIRALKVISKASVKNVYQLFSVNTELCIMSQLAVHPNVVRAYGALHTETNIVLVMDYSGKQNLHSFITSMLKTTGETVLPPDIVTMFVKQAALSVAHLHSCMVCHRDLKPTNFIVDDAGDCIRLTDFGLAAMVFGSQRLVHCCGSLPFAAPEVLRLQQQKKATAQGYNGFAADVWSLAVNFVELTCGIYSMDRLLNWSPQPPADAAQRLCDLENFGQVWRQVPEKKTVPGLHRVMDNMLILPAEERWTISRVIREGLGLVGCTHACSVKGCMHNL